MLASRCQLWVAAELARPGRVPAGLWRGQATSIYRSAEGTGKLKNRHSVSPTTVPAVSVLWGAAGRARRLPLLGLGLGLRLRDLHITDLELSRQGRVVRSSSNPTRLGLDDQEHGRVA